MSILITILHFRESEFNYLEANENNDTNYDLTEEDLCKVEREIYEEECDSQLEAYNYFTNWYNCEWLNYIYILYKLDMPMIDLDDMRMSMILMTLIYVHVP